jgi:hypothetical protein
MIRDARRISETGADILYAEIWEILPISASLAPPASISSKSVTRTRAPATVGRPPQMAKSKEIRGCPLTVIAIQIVAVRSGPH